jgi:hypothetical protein
MTAIMVTGTRQGMTLDQWDAFQRAVVATLDIDGQHVFHDGDCEGADSQALGVVRKLREQGWNVETHGHPCNGTAAEWRAFNEHDVEHDPLPPITRNRVMVDQSRVVFAAPKEWEEDAPVRGSGTWATIRYARRNLAKLAKLVIVWPDGSVTEEVYNGG